MKSHHTPVIAKLAGAATVAAALLFAWQAPHGATAADDPYADPAEPALP